MRLSQPQDMAIVLVTCVLFLGLLLFEFNDRKKRLQSFVRYQKKYEVLRSPEEAVLALFEQGKEYPLVLIEVKAIQELNFDSVVINDAVERLVEQKKIECIMLNEVRHLGISSEPDSYIPYALVYKAV